MLKRAIVVGASSGIGAALVRRLVAAGYRVAAIARREPALTALCDELILDGVPRALPFVHDVRHIDEAPELFVRIVRELDGLDLIVYAAGVMPNVAPDQFDTAIDAGVIEVNVIGAMSWLNLAASRFQTQRSGTICGIGSVAGDRGRRGNPAYCASKAALHTYLEALRNRLTQHGVHVLTVKPGPVHTPMTEGRTDLPMAIQPEQAAEAIHRAIARGAQTAYVPLQWALVMGAIRSVPSVVFRRLNV